MPGIYVDNPNDLPLVQQLRAAILIHLSEPRPDLTICSQADGFHIQAHWAVGDVWATIRYGIGIRSIISRNELIAEFMAKRLEKRKRRHTAKYPNTAGPMKTYEPGRCEDCGTSTGQVPEILKCDACQALWVARFRNYRLGMSVEPEWDAAFNRGRYRMADPMFIARRRNRPPPKETA